LQYQPSGSRCSSLGLHKGERSHFIRITLANAVPGSGPNGLIGFCSPDHRQRLTAFYSFYLPAHYVVSTTPRHLESGKMNLIAVSIWGLGPRTGYMGRSSEVVSFYDSSSTHMYFIPCSDLFRASIGYIRSLWRIILSSRGREHLEVGASKPISRFPWFLVWSQCTLS
jgi:hypothetical protein